jgi:hypothetical protein
MKTAVQQVFSELEELHPNLFNVYTTEGKEFINHFHKYIAMEKEQIIEAHFTSSGCNSFDIEESRVNSAYKAAQEYYNETYKQL